MSYNARLAELNISLPAAPAPAGMYKPVIQSGNLLYLAGHIPTTARGKVGVDLTVEEAAEVATEVAHLMLATLQNHLGSLDRVEQIVKVFGLVNCPPEFTDIPQVINGFSKVMLDVFGEAGRAARSSVGAVSLPLGVPVEVEAIVEVKTV